MSDSSSIWLEVLFSALIVIGVAVVATAFYLLAGVIYE